MTPTIELEYWQAAMDLSDWAISIKYGRVDPKHDAEIDYDLRDKVAAITIREGKTGSELSRLVMHELIHLVIAPLALRTVGRGREAVEEKVVEHIEGIMRGIEDER